MNFTTVIRVNGTKKSERGVGLDSGDCSTFTIKPGEYHRRLQSIDELVVQIARSASERGEWISSLSVNGVDLVGREIEDLLILHHGDVEVVLQSLAEIDMFCNANGDDLRPIVLCVKDELSGAN